MPSATETGRRVCPRCGANNFDTQAACWKCGAGLVGSAPPVAPPVAPVASPPLRPSASDVPGARPVTPARPATTPVDPAIANWTAIISSLLMPYIMLPVGVVFLMLDDKRKLEVGRITLIASVVGTILHTIAFAAFSAAVYQQLLPFLPGMAGKAQEIRSAREGEANRSMDLNQPAQPLQLEGLRPMAPAR